MTSTFRRTATMFAASFLLVSGVAGADDADDARRLQESTQTLINLMVQNGVMTREKADGMIGQVREPAAAPAAPGAEASQSDALRRLRNANADLVNLLVEKGLLQRDVGSALIDQAQPNRFGTPSPRAPQVIAPVLAAPVAALPASPTPTPSVAPIKVPVPAVAAVPKGEPGPAPLPLPPVQVVPVIPEGTPPPPVVVTAPDLSPALPAIPVARPSASAVVPLSAAPPAAAAPAVTAPAAALAPGAATPPTAMPAAGAPAADAAPVAPGPVAPGVVRVQYVPQIVRDQIKEEVKQEVLAQAHDERWGEPGALPEWLRRLTFYGDVRVREEMDRFDGSRPNADPAFFSAPPYGYLINNTDDTRYRFRLRARAGIGARISDQISAGLRLASGSVGSGSTPVSENVSLGNYNTRNTIGIDRAFIRYQPWPGLEVVGGRFDNPFYAPTELVWSGSDALSLEGISVRYSLNFRDDWQAGVNGGVFPIQQKDNQLIPTPNSDAEDKWLYGIQTTLGWRFTPRDRASLAVAYYHYDHVEGCLDTAINDTDCDSSTAGFRQFGNQVFDIRRLTNEANNTQAYLFGLVSEFRELNVSGSLDLGVFDPLHVMVDADYVRNLGFDRDEITRRTRITDGELLKAQDTGYQVRVAVGTPKVAALGQWQVYTGYRRVERDAVLDAFTDSDFHLGGTNAKGYFLGGRYGIAPRTAFSLRWLSADEIDGPPLAIDVLQLDLTTGF